MDNGTLENFILPLIDSSMNRHSRIHPLRNYIPSPDSLVYLKREDELSSGIVGSKWRKYLSVLPAIEAEYYDEVVLIGSANSNNVPGLTQLLKERNIPVHCFLKEPGDTRLLGNRLFISMLLPPSAITLVKGHDWPQVESIAEDYLQHKAHQGLKVLVVPEGGACKESLAGSLTLALDILKNERDNDITFTQIYTDSGTGVSAIGLLLGFQLLGIHDREITITQIANDIDGFNTRYEQFGHWLSKLINAPIPEANFSVQHLSPVSAKSFGSINKTVLQETLDITRSTGILMDPVYSVKHLQTVKADLQSRPSHEPSLILYNGGALGLCGFQTSLANIIQGR